jgi:hypothetical protein
MEKVESKKLSKQGDEVIVSLVGSSENAKMTCELALNPNLVNAATTISFEYEPITPIETGASDVIQKDDATIDLSDLDYSEKQKNTTDTKSSFSSYT